MHLPAQTGKLKTKPTLAENVERLRMTLNLKEAAWLDILGMTSREYRSFVLGDSDLSILGLLRLSDHLGIGLETLMKGEIDFKAVAAKYSGNPGYVPERYSVAAFSRRRSPLNLLNAVEEFLGWRVRDQVLRHLQVSEAVFSNPDEMINIRFNTDLCDYLQKTFACQEMFFGMGAYSVITNQNSEVSRHMSGCKTVDSMYEYFVEEMLGSHWELNHRYRLLSLTPTSCQIESVVSQELSDGLGTHQPGSAYTCQTKAGVSASIPGYKFATFAHVRETACIHRGDSSCIHEVDFEFAAHSLSKTGSKFSARAGHA